MFLYEEACNGLLYSACLALRRPYSMRLWCRYGMDRRDGKGLAELLRELGRLEGLRWIRILYAYPSYFDDALIDEIASNPKAGLLDAALCDVGIDFWCALTVDIE